MPNLLEMTQVSFRACAVNDRRCLVRSPPSQTGEGGDASDLRLATIGQSNLPTDHIGKDRVNIIVLRAKTHEARLE